MFCSRILSYRGSSPTVLQGWILDDLNSWHIILFISRFQWLSMGLMFFQLLVPYRVGKLSPLACSIIDGGGNQFEGAYSISVW